MATTSDAARVRLTFDPGDDDKAPEFFASIVAAGDLKAIHGASVHILTAPPALTITVTIDGVCPDCGSLEGCLRPAMETITLLAKVVEDAVDEHGVKVFIEIGHPTLILPGPRRNWEETAFYRAV